MCVLPFIGSINPCTFFSTSCMIFFGLVVCFFQDLVFFSATCTFIFLTSYNPGLTFVGFQTLEMVMISYIFCFNPVISLFWFMFTQLIRRKSNKKNVKGKRKCNCKTETKMKNVGGGRFAMYEDEKCDWCPRVKYECDLIFLAFEFHCCTQNSSIGTIPC